MPASTIIYLPLNTYVNVRSFTNAAFLQRVTITPETGSPITIQGNGEHDTPIPNGNFHLETPGSSISPLGYSMNVKVETSPDGGRTWENSQVSQGSCSVMYYHLAMVVSEDYVDQDWNDAVVQFTWWIPPTLR
jgi:hypothetical protein